jgi:NAD(P)-dependent dehydrogenase (short-subunit alcohol dehydrogenase family)
VDHEPRAIVTGGNRGTAAALRRSPAPVHVVVLDHEHDAVTRRRRRGCRAGRRATFVGCDIADLAAHAAALDAAWTFAGRVDCLVNNAGVGVARGGDMLDVTPESFDRVVSVNLRGTFFSPGGGAADVAEGAGEHRSIVTISSSNAEIASPERAEYCIAKAGLAMLTRLLAVRLAGEGIMAYDIRPGLIRTDMTRASQQKYDRLLAEGFTPIARWGEPDDVARAVTMLARGDLPFVTGEAIHVDGGLHIHKF